MSTTTKEKVTAKSLPAPMTEIALEPGRSPKTEELLAAVRVKWEFVPALPWTKVDLQRSLQNQARLDPLIPEVVERYTAAMERGDVFPAVLAQDRGPKNKMLLLGGNHRGQASLLAGRATTPAYVVFDVTPETAVRLTFEDNSAHGMPPTDRERVFMAIHLMGIGWTQENAAAAVGISSQTLSRERAFYAALSRAKDEAEIDYDSFNALKKANVIALGRLKSDPVFIEASNLAIRAKLSTEEVKKLCQEISKTRSDGDALLAIGLETEAYEHRVQKTAGGKVKKTSTPRNELLGVIRKIGVLQPQAVLGSTPTAEARKDLKREIDGAIGRLEAMRTALD